MKESNMGHFLCNMRSLRNISTIVWIFLFLCSSRTVRCEGWSDIKIRLLPDSSFAAIEYDDTGQKYRRFPYRDANGNIDEEQLVYVLGVFEKEIWIDSKHKATARKHLEKQYYRLRSKLIEKGLDQPVNIRDATLVQLVSLPTIGPVLAVKIIQFRNSHPLFMHVDDIKKVDGISTATFNAIRHYITCQ
jgi:Helix-hairpin-helix motif